MLLLEQVTKEYDDGPNTIRALDALDLAVEPGMLAVVMGPSGSGKSTLALIAAGVIAPSSGTVHVGDIDIGRARADARARLRRRHVGVVFQHDELDPVLSVVENVELPLMLDNWARHDARAHATATLARCGLAALADRVPAELSGGERQRVAIARAVTGNRQLIVADEPTAALDTATARVVVELIVALASQGVAVLLTTHDTRLAGYADEIVLLRDGRRIDSPGAARAPIAIADTTSAELY
jgi:putative ABC transport system ATP-binding protein